MIDILKSSLVVLGTVMLAACGSGDRADNSPSVQQTEKRTCDSIRPEVIRIAANNGVSIVNIYKPKVLKDEPKKISCSGRALVSSGQEAVIYYRDYQDGDADWLVEYAEKPLD